MLVVHCHYIDAYLITCNILHLAATLPTWHEQNCNDPQIKCWLSSSPIKISVKTLIFDIPQTMVGKTADVDNGKLTQCSGNKRERVAATTAKTNKQKLVCKKFIQMYIHMCV